MAPKRLKSDIIAVTITMSIDFSPSSSANTVSTGKPVDLQTLQETFAAALRHYSEAKGGAQTETMLEVLQTSSSDNTELRKQERQELQQRIDRNDVTQIDQKLQNKSEIRQGDMSADYQNQRDRSEMLHHDYKEKINQRTFQESATLTDRASSATSENFPNDSPGLNELPVSGNDVRPQNTITNNVSAPALPVSATVAAIQHSPARESAIAALPMNVNVPAPTSAVPASPVPPMQTFTIFTASKRFGQSQEKPDEKEEEEEEKEASTEKPVSTHRPFAVFESIQSGAMLPARRKQSGELPVQGDIRQAAVPIREKPKENEPNQFSGVKTLDEFLNTPQSVFVPKKEESNQPDQTQYFHRVAAACEAAARYAPIRIKVHLGHLGTLTLRFFYQSEKLNLQFETPTKESARFLQDHLDGLKTLLTKRNVQLSSVEVLLTDKVTASGGRGEHQ